jgi:hypothetical protein
MASGAEQVTRRARRDRGGSGEEKAEKKAFECPDCLCDVMETGWTEESRITKSYMRFYRRGAVLIASTQAVADTATCFQCGARLPFKPMELVKAA